jgi:hypothetical protein
MVGKNYVPAEKPELHPAYTLKGGTKIPALWKVTGKAMALLKPRMSANDLWWLRTQMAGQAICPEYYLFPDTPEVRKVLQVEADEPTKHQQ